MSRTVNIFIPFIEMNISEAFIKKVLLHQQFGQIVDVSMHEKKIKENNKVRSAKHRYVFAKLEFVNTFSSNNLRKNIENNLTTHVIFNMDAIQGHLEIKPYLTISDRMERGFDLHIKDVSSLDNEEDSSYSNWLGTTFSFRDEKDANPLLSWNKTPSFYDDMNEKLECERDYYDIEAALNPYYTSSQFISLK